MIHERARVLELDGDDAWVACDSQAGCQRCAEGKGCGGGLFSALLGRRLQRVRVANRIDARAGDAVWLALDERLILAASVAAYGLPLLGLLGGGAVAAWRGGGDLAVAALGIAGFAVGLLLGRWWSRRGARRRFVPALVGRVNAGDRCGRPQ